MLKAFIGLIGVIIAAISSEFNDQVSSIASADVSGGLNIGHDAQTWYDSLYITAEIFGMAVSPALFVTFTLRQFMLFTLLLNAVSSSLIPFCHDETGIYMLRMGQGFAGGLTIPMLMTTALRVLNPEIRIYGLALYAITATFTPAMATTMAALWTDLVGWQFVFFEAIPLCALAAVLVWYGMPQDEPDYGRLRIFDWRGTLLLIIGLGAFSTMLQQGDRLDWFASPVICVLALASAIGIPLFLVNEWFTKVPLMRLQLVKRRNMAYGLIALFAFIIIAQSSSTLPDQFLVQVQGFRPEQLYPLTLMFAVLQIVMLPAMAWVLDHPRVDARFVSFVGLALIVGACLNTTLITSTWYPGALIISEVLQAVGQPMVIMALLMMTTNSVQGPEEAPYAASLFNTPRAVAEAVGVWLVQLIQRWRGGLHYNRIADQIGLERYRLIQAPSIVPAFPAPLAATAGVTPPPGSLAPLGTIVRLQSLVLTVSDAYLIFAALTCCLIVVLLIVPERTLPPRIQLAQK